MEVKDRIDIDNSKLSMPFIKVNINYLEHVRGRSCINSTYHSHNDWQAEFIIDGKVTCHLSDRDIEITPLKIIIIPSGIYHSFRYDDKNSNYYSVKFTCDLDGIKAPLLFDNAENVEPIRKYLDEIVTHNSNKEIVAIHMQNLLKILLEIDLVNSKALTEKNISEQVIDILAKSPSQFPTAEEISEMMNISRAYLSKKIKDETGVSLKPFIDIQRINTAKTLLQLSELSISEIAFQLGFIDVFSFSRFFKRILFVSPSQYRNKFQCEDESDTENETKNKDIDDEKSSL